MANWPGEIPEVHRWPYDYAKDGRDFIPQTEPLGSNESAIDRNFIGDVGYGLLHNYFCF